jgi:small neutral amino acid transporter SnatA (MarC family)
MSRSVQSSTHCLCSCLPDTAGRVAAASFAIMLTAATALTVAILLPQYPGLNSIFYPVFSVAGGFAFIVFAIALITMCKTLPPQEPKQRKRNSYPMPPIVTPMPFPMLGYSTPHVMPNPHAQPVQIEEVDT